MVVVIDIKDVRKLLDIVLSRIRCKDLQELRQVIKHTHLDFSYTIVNVSYGYHLGIAAAQAKAPSLPVLVLVFLRPRAENRRAFFAPSIASREPVVCRDG